MSYIAGKMDNKMIKSDRLRREFRYIANINGHIDTDDAAKRIKSSIWFRGPNVYILAFSIIIASAGLNVNSTAVIIGAMLISPLMGPIIGMGLALGTDDTELLGAALKNLLVMVVISLVASTVFFLLSPLKLTNPTELAARTSPTIYDVLIAFFGGLAGILENSRKERGTVLSGVAIATALMPPLCTAGYGLATLDMHYFLGAMYLFTINGIFITIATYLMVKYLKFKPVEGVSITVSKERRNLMTAILVLFLVPSVWNVVSLVKDNNFDRKAARFVAENKRSGHSYVYDYKVTTGRHRSLELMMAGEIMDGLSKQDLLDKAEKAGIPRERVVISEHKTGMTIREMESLLDDVYRRTEDEMSRKNAEIDNLRSRIDSLVEVVGAMSRSSGDGESEQ